MEAEEFLSEVVLPDFSKKTFAFLLHAAAKQYFDGYSLQVDARNILFHPLLEPFYVFFKRCEKLLALQVQNTN